MPGQRMLARLDLFDAETTGIVLSQKRYWNSAFARQYIDSWNQVAFEDPWAGRRLAETGVKLVEKLEAEEKRVLYPHALAVWGSSCRTTGDSPGADEAFNRALKIYQTQKLPRLDEADLYRRIAYRCRDGNRWKEAMAYVDDAIEICTAIWKVHDLGLAYYAKASVYFYMLRHGIDVCLEEPLECLSKAIEYVSVKLMPFIYESASNNLGLLLIEGRHNYRPSTLKDLLRRLDRAKRQQARLGFTRKSYPNIKLRWTMGLVWKRARATERAKSLLLRARKDLISHDFWEDVSSITVDISEILIDDNCWGILQSMVEEIVQIEGRFSPEVNSVLIAWLSAIKRRHVDEGIRSEVLRKVRGVQPISLNE